ncbi:MAG TPA: HdeD family acid-resistance protein [Polyangiaceae bacterium]|nr:HdeD family acid-resistance protein [Polyangiaceae bacterium]
MRIPISEAEVWTVSWWSLVLRGLAGVAFGVLSFLAPSISLAALVLCFGAYAFVDGVFAIVLALRKPERGGRWWALLLQGIIGIAAGVATLFLPLVTALALVYLVATWAIVTGALEIVTAVRLRKIIEGEWLLGLTGLLSVALGVSLALFPGPGALALVIWIGAYAVLSGAILITLGIRARSWQRGSSRPPLAHAEAPP